MKLDTGQIVICSFGKTFKSAIVVQSQCRSRGGIKSSAPDWAKKRTAKISHCRDFIRAYIASNRNTSVLFNIKTHHQCCVQCQNTSQVLRSTLNHITSVAFNVKTHHQCWIQRQVTSLVLRSTPSHINSVSVECQNRSLSVVFNVQSHHQCCVQIQVTSTVFAFNVKSHHMFLSTSSHINSICV